MLNYKNHVKKNYKKIFYQYQHFIYAIRINFTTLVFYDHSKIKRII